MLGGYFFLLDGTIEPGLARMTSSVVGVAVAFALSFFGFFASRLLRSPLAIEILQMKRRIYVVLYFQYIAPHLLNTQIYFTD